MFFCVRYPGRIEGSWVDQPEESLRVRLPPLDRTSGSYTKKAYFPTEEKTVILKFFSEPRMESVSNNSMKNTVISARSCNLRKIVFSRNKIKYFFQPQNSAKHNLERKVPSSSLHCSKTRHEVHDTTQPLSLAHPNKQFALSGCAVIAVVRSGFEFQCLPSLILQNSHLLTVVI